MRISFIGGGNMGEAMLSALLGHGLARPADIAVSDVSDARRQYLAGKYHVAVSGDNRQVASSGDIVVLAVKPQNLAAVMAGLNGGLRKGQVVLSIIAGARIETMQRGLDHEAIIRSMPNTPAQVGEGMTVWTASAAVTPVQREHVRPILAAMGKEVFVSDEQFIDMATAVSGSGPAYFFYFMEALTGAAVSIGIPQDTAEQLVMQTVLGAGQLLKNSGKSPAELRRMVTSPGGTTAAAISEFEGGNLAGLVQKAVTAAYNRAQALGKQQ